MMGVTLVLFSLQSCKCALRRSAAFPSYPVLFIYSLLSLMEFCDLYCRWDSPLSQGSTPLSNLQNLTLCYLPCLHLTKSVDRHESRVGVENGDYPGISKYFQSNYMGLKTEGFLPELRGARTTGKREERSQAAAGFRGSRAKAQECDCLWAHTGARKWILPCSLQRECGEPPPRSQPPGMCVRSLWA